ncbi:MAG: TIGR03571 family LLM class oxidoreductase [Kofleriaceae bacterium]
MLTPGSGDATDNPGWKRCFRAPGAMTLGLWMPIEAVWRATPALVDQERLARRAEELGFAALWLRDIPLRDPSFGDVGQVHDVFVYLAWLAAHTQTIALATGAVVLPLRHPLHVAKAAASIDQLSRGRLILGIASGDRPIEFPAFGRSRDDAPAEVRAALDAIRLALRGDAPADVVPKPVARELPIVVAGHAGQSLEWIATNAHGWITWPRPPEHQAALVRSWREAVAASGAAHKPLAKALFVDLATDPDLDAWPIRLGVRVGRNRLLALLEQLEASGIDHVALSLTPGHRPASEVLDELGEWILPRFAATRS